MSHAELLQRLLSASLIFSAALLLVLALRPLLHRHGGAQLAHASWLLPPLTLVASLLPYPAAPLPALRLVTGPAAFSASPAGGASAAWWSSPSLLLGAWLCGVAGLAAWLLWRQWRFQHRLGRLQPLSTQPPLYSASGDLSAGPLVLGLLRPRVVVPVDFHSRYTAQEQALIVAHEQIHLQRGDLPAQALASALQVLFWFNPLVHLAMGRFRLDQELACDAAMLRSQPHAQALYAATLLKVQLDEHSRPAPLGCQWQGGHPLKTRIQRLAQAAPSPARRTAARSAWTACTLAACLGAWAAEQAPATWRVEPASTPGDPPGKRYQVAFTGVDEVQGQRKLSTQMDLPLQAGERLVLPAQPGRLNCDITLELKELAADRVEIRLPFSCDGSAVRNPRLITGLGQRASIQTGSKAAGEHTYTFTVVVTPWPETTPWPR